MDKLDTAQWLHGMYGTETTWKESEVYNEYKKGTLDEWSDLDSFPALEDWCKLMMIKILGKDIAISKYPEMWI